MARPDDRPLRRLPQLAPRKATLETCAFCPKLCRSSCPVSNAEPRETLTPWGKMSSAYFLANESVPLSRSFAAPAWACTGCFGCREHCDHENDVTGTLFAARSALVTEGVAPPAATRVLERFAERTAVLGKIGERPGVRTWVDPKATTAVLVGCEHARQETWEAEDIVRAAALLERARTRAVERTKVAIVEVCCGAPLLYAGETARFAAQGALFAKAVAGKERVIVGDAGCAATLRVHHAADGGALPIPRISHLAEDAGQALGDLGRIEGPLAGTSVRWHDPCQLGRGLGVYDAPRQVLARVLGRNPGEFERHHEDARCSGAGGLLPLTMPDVAREIARERVADHDRSGGGAIVTACASSARAFRARGAQVFDLATLIRQALESNSAAE
jgi:dimethylglycine catabolism B